MNWRDLALAEVIKSAQSANNRWLEENPQPEKEQISQKIIDLVFSEDPYRFCQALLLVKRFVSVNRILLLATHFGRVEWLDGLRVLRDIADADVIFKEIEHDVPLEKRVKFLRAVRELDPDNHGSYLCGAIKYYPEKVIEMIQATSFAPMIMKYRNGTFDHELENLCFCFNEAEVHEHFEIVKVLWDKLVQETPEPTLYGLEFLNRYINSHPNWEQFAEFVFRDLFGKPRRGWTDTEKVIKNLISVNGLWPNVVLEAVENISNEEKRKEKINSFNDYWKEREFQKGRLSKEESIRVIKRIDKLFF